MIKQLYETIKIENVKYYMRSSSDKHLETYYFILI